MEFICDRIVLRIATTPMAPQLGTIVFVIASVSFRCDVGPGIRVHEYYRAVMQAVMSAPARQVCTGGADIICVCSLFSNSRNCSMVSHSDCLAVGYNQMVSANDAHMMSDHGGAGGNVRSEAHGGHNV